MPELPYTEKDVLAADHEFKVKDMEHLQKEGYQFLSEQNILKILEGTNLNLIGQGAECVVLSRTDSTNNLPWWKKIFSKPEEYRSLVIALDYRDIKTPIEARKLFYAHRIMSTLFPNNFARFVSSYSVENSDIKMSGTVRSKLNISKTAKEEYGSDLDKESKHPFKTVLDTVKELDLHFYFDNSPVNYALGQNNGVFYLDKIIFGQISRPTREKVTQWMIDNGFDQKNMTLVINAMNRLDAIEEEGLPIKT